MPNEGQSLVQQPQALIQSVLDSLSRSREVITRLDSTRPPKPPGGGQVLTGRAVLCGLHQQR
jgi:hypothetical protein